MRFFLGTHRVSQPWWDAAVPLFISRVQLENRKTLPVPQTEWALDSGGFTELSLFGEWRLGARQYATLVRRFDDMGHMAWAAPQDWMCEPHVLAKTGLTVTEHQRRTVTNFLRLRYGEELGDTVIPVLQGWERDDYLRCVEMYAAEGVYLDAENTVGLGTVCRRQNTAEAGKIVRALRGIRLHGFGIKITGLHSFGDALTSADSMAWSYGARLVPPLRGCTHKSCNNCLRYALRWRDQVMAGLGQQRLEVAV